MNDTTHLPDSGFGKIFQSTYTGSLMGSGPVVLAVWPYIIANTKPPGIVELVPRYIAAVLGCDHADVVKAIKFLETPDDDSRTKVENGRRLIHRTGHIYEVPTWSIYREKRDDEARKAYFREAKRRSRMSKNVQDNLGLSNLSTQAEAEAEATKPISLSPQAPKGGVADGEPEKKDDQSRESERVIPSGAKRWAASRQKRTRVNHNSPGMIRLGQALGRRPETLWTVSEALALAELKPTEDEINAILDYYNDPSIPEDKDYRRKSLETLLNNWNTELDRAKLHKINSKTR